MNKTLLLILCDFLLLTILSMWKMEKEAPASSEVAADAADDSSVSAMAMMEQDLLDTLKYSLEEEAGQSQQLTEDLAAKAAELERQQAELEARESRIQNLEGNLTEAQLREQALAAERAELQSQVQDTQAEVSQISEQLADAEAKALQGQAQSRLLQEELDRKLEEIERKEQALAEATAAAAAAQRQAQELDVKVRLVEQEKEFLQTSVVTLENAVVAERAERERLQEQAGVLAQGVSELAASSQDLREELRSNFEINENQLFSDFENNQIAATFQATKYSRNRFLDTNTSSATILVSDGTDIFALLHLENSPIGLRTNPATVRDLSLDLRRQGGRLAASEMRFLALDPRIVAVPLSPEEAAGLGGKPYLTALEPFKFPEAVLVNRDGNYYGEVDFKLDADTPGFVKMQSKFFSALFGEFSPSTGDLVFSKTGELLGVMVNKRYCALVNSFLPAASLKLGPQFDQVALRTTLRSLNNTLDTFPDPLR